jgi:hypothetical protein
VHHELSRLDHAVVMYEQRVRQECRAAVNQSRTGPPVMISRLWYRAVLCDALVGVSQVPMIREHFADALGTAGWPDGACLFVSTRQASGKKVRENDSAVAEAVFFSPAAIAEVPHLIAVCGAIPSPPPVRECSILLVGKQSDWDLLPRDTH